jgi:hypothetical protein
MSSSQTARRDHRRDNTYFTPAKFEAAYDRQTNAAAEAVSQ